MKKFTCDLCHQTYTSDWTEKQSMEEYESIFGTDMGEEKGVICDDCHNKFMEWFKSEGKIGTQ